MSSLARCRNETEHALGQAYVGERGRVLCKISSFADNVSLTATHGADTSSRYALARHSTTSSSRDWERYSRSD